MLPTLQIGPLALQVPGLVLILGLWAGLSLAERRAPRHKIDPTSLYNLVFLALLAGLLGARLAYAARYPAAFASSPGSLLSLNPGLLDLLGGLASAGLAGLVYAQRKRLPFWPSLDALTPLFAVLGVALGLAHLASGDAFGAPAELPWAVQLWGARRHPSQVYETVLAAFILFAILHPAVERRLERPGLRFLGFVALTAASRLFLEAFRGDSTLVAGGLRLTQLAAWLVLALALWGIHRLRGIKDVGTTPGG